MRRYVRDAGDQLERLHILTRSDCTTRNQRKATRLRQTYEELEWRIDELSKAGGAGRAASRPGRHRRSWSCSACRPGPVVGEAYRFLLERRIEEGPLGEERAKAGVARVVAAIGTRVSELDLRAGRGGLRLRRPAAGHRTVLDRGGDRRVRRARPHLRAGARRPCSSARACSRPCELMASSLRRGRQRGGDHGRGAGRGRRGHLRPGRADARGPRTRRAARGPPAGRGGQQLPARRCSTSRCARAGSVGPSARSWQPTRSRTPSRLPTCTCEACRQLGVDPAECLAFEDTGTGAAAAHAAGMRVIGVPSPEATRSSPTASSRPRRPRPARLGSLPLTGGPGRTRADVRTRTRE